MTQKETQIETQKITQINTPKRYIFQFFITLQPYNLIETSKIRCFCFEIYVYQSYISMPIILILL